MSADTPLLGVVEKPLSVGRLREKGTAGIQTYSDMAHRLLPWSY